MKFYLCDRNPKIIEAWNQFFGDNEDFRIRCGDVFDGEPTDAIVSPANSFGFMDGGIDGYYIFRFGQQLEDNLRESIINHHHGELPVGQATIVSTWDKSYPWLISAPTMRVPGSVKNSANAYLAFRAVLLAVQEFNKDSVKINSITCPGLGTAIGQIEPWACARQMFEAYERIHLNEVFIPQDCADIWYNNQQLIGWAPTEFKHDGRVIKGE